MFKLIENKRTRRQWICLWWYSDIQWLGQRQRDCSTVSQPSAASQEVHHIITYEPFRRCVNYLIAHSHSRYIFSVKITISVLCSKWKRVCVHNNSACRTLCLRAPLFPLLLSGRAALLSITVSRYVSTAARYRHHCQYIHPQLQYTIVNFVSINSRNVHKTCLVQ